ncbi:hypothetical protein [Bacillus sp. XF8]|uniref:hypothetical protein n=1 Tax=Bacillus sp. XF8 TaxID=2819289 RepID=UPI001AA024DE|nr:hypothetical protein [Bacillus sp. XF8]MBO1580117.1 hypothetical protein [Bacillus sp. XF8]
MIEEKKNQNIRWYVDNNLRIRIQEISDGKAGLWVTLDKRNICFTMIMYDFMDWCEREISINLEVDKSWNNHRGFIIESSDQVIVISEIKRFITEFNIKPNENADQFLDAEWYA